MRLRASPQVSITRPRLRHRGRLPQNQTPAFQWYPRDWLTSRAVMKMSPSQRSYYFDLLCHAWLSDRPGFIPNDPDLLWRLARAKSREAFEREADLVLAQFRKGKRGELFHPRLTQERRAQERRKSDMSKRGAAGAKARWNSKIDGTRNAQAMLTDGSASASAYASASASAKSNSKSSTATLDDLKKSFLSKCHDPQGIVTAAVEIICDR